jgi:protein-S-isoprenylcysteine O-methyltransferase Ste14
LIAAGDRGAKSAAWRTALFTIFVPGTFAVLIPHLLLERYPAAPWNSLGPRVAGILLIAVGVAGYLACATSFVRRGRGTPGPWDPPRTLVVSDLYTRVRNPMYVSVILLLAGEALLFRSAALLLYALVVFLAFHLRVILAEEPTLERQFGESFREYRRHVPRWIPRWRPH